MLIEPYWKIFVRNKKIKIKHIGPRVINIFINLKYLLVTFYFMIDKEYILLETPLI